MRLKVDADTQCTFILIYLAVIVSNYHVKHFYRMIDNCRLIL